MKRFNVCLIKPENYAHAHAFWELGELLYFSLKELGCEVALGFNNLDPASQNILIGCHLLDPDLIAQVPRSTIILNTEQIYSDTTDWSKNILPWMSSFRAWDYSSRNIDKFKELGLAQVQLLKIGYQKELKRLDRSRDKDVDVLFYGSVNERRAAILSDLEARGLKVKALFGVYGKERDQWIERSRVVLNHHFYSSQIFEIVRVFYLLTNAVAVVGEVNETTQIEPMYRDGICAARYEELVDRSVEIARNDRLRQDIEARALDAISSCPQVAFMRELVEP
jgi:hypothetical protein